MSFIRTTLLASTLLIGTQAAMAETSLDQSSQKNLSLTIYQNGLGFVEDLRQAPLQQGAQTIAFEDISSQLIPDSLLISGKGFNVMERRLAFDLLTPAILLQKSIGQEVTFRRLNPVTGLDELIRAKVLSTQGGLVIERDGKIETGQPGNLVLDDLPNGLRPKPALMTDLQVAQSGETDLGLAYLTNGVKWHSSYSAEISPDEKSISLKAWANLTNTSGTDYKNVDIRVAAGRINRSPAPRPVPAMMKAAAPRGMVMDGAAEMTANAPQAIGGIHLYQLPVQVDLNNKETKQVALIKPLEFDAKRTLVHRFNPVYGAMRNDSSQPVHPNIEVSFENTSGQPLPNGTARLYRKNKDNALTFVGEDTLKQTPNGSVAALVPGQSFDVTLKRIQTDYQVDGKYRFEAAYKILIKNAKKTAEKVRIIDSFPGEWALEESNIVPKDKAARNATWEIEVPGESEKVLTYRVEIRTR